VALDNSFGVASLVNADGTAVDWSLVNLGTYTLIGTTSSSFNNIDNFCSANAATVGDKLAYFKDGSLQLVVTAIPEATSLAVLAGVSVMMMSRRRNKIA